MTTLASLCSPPEPEHCFWLIATKPCGRVFRLKIKRCWLFAVTLGHWPVKINAPPITAASARAAFDQLPPQSWNQLPHGAQMKLHRWLHHFAERHAGVMISCTGTLDLNPAWTRAVNRQTTRQELARLLLELRRMLNLDPTDMSPILIEGRDWCDALEKHLQHKEPRSLLQPSPAYTAAQVAEGQKIIADMKRGGWLRPNPSAS